MNSSLIWKQIQMLWCDLRDPKTGGTLLPAMTRIWRVLVQLALLVFLVVLLAIAGIIWFWGVAYQSGREDRQWSDQHPDGNSNTFAMYVISKNLLAPFKWLVALSHEIIHVILGIKPTNDASVAPKQLTPATGSPANTVSVSTAKIPG